MSYQPPFIITAEILNRVSRISEQVGAINAALLQGSPTLRKQNRIKTITGTLAIEGNTLTETQVTAILEGKPVLGSARELAEVQGAIQAYEALPTLDPCQLDHVLQAHRLMMGDILKEAGHFRRSSVGIHKGEAVVHVAPPAHRVPGLMADLLQWTSQSDHHPLIVSSVFHYEFEFIHPFADGNGRLGRLWQTLILSKWKTLFLSLPLESVIEKHQQGYYQALEQADQQADCTGFVAFMLKIIEATLDKNVTVNDPVSGTVSGTVNPAELETSEAVLALIAGNRAITRQQMADRIGKSLRTISRAVKQLQEAGRLERVGSDKAGHWMIVESRR